MEGSSTETGEKIPSDNAGNISKSSNETTIADTSDQKNNSTSSTAFTISFEDDNTSSKKLGIRDPIQKFAPPKPQSVEKPRPSKSLSCQDHSITSVESAPAGLSKHFTRDSKRSSERVSSSSRIISGRNAGDAHLSESAAFLIDKMLYYRQSHEDPQTSRGRGEMSSRKSPRGPTRSDQRDLGKLQHDSSVDNCDDKSDNGTYILGADPESDVARKKIDELFGVVKAAEASLIADSVARNSRKETPARSSGRQSRTTDKKLVNHQPTYTSNSRSSSACREESSYSNVENYYPRTSSRHSRNSSCDRTAKPLQSRPKRSFSQSSRHSSGKKLSDADSSSRSSLNNDAYASNQENSLPNLPSMKFNRAFALRRARLGLEPTPRVSTTQGLDLPSSLSSSPRRQVSASSGPCRPGPGQLNREDGGRYSLRVKNSLPPGRLGAQNSSLASRYSQYNSTVDSYVNRLSANRLGSSVLGPYEAQARGIIPSRQVAHHSAAYQSGHEEPPEPISPSRYRLAQKSSMSHMSGQSDIDNEEHLNYSLGAVPTDPSSYHLHEGISDRRGSALQLGALDSLVISAISSLSLKIRLSVCDLMVEHAKKLPIDNETRIVVEEIIPQLVAETSSSKSPTSIDEINQALYFDLAKTLKNLKKVEQMVDVMNMMANQIPSVSVANATGSPSTSGSASNHIVNSLQETGTVRTSESAGTSASERNSAQDLSSV